jgi:predicted Zn finger-like uncharacterized protein
MALATRCPRCDATFRVVSDQLKLRGGLVRCGSCRHVFDAIGSLSYVEESALQAADPNPADDKVRPQPAVRSAEASPPAAAEPLAPLPARVAPAAAAGAGDPLAVPTLVIPEAQELGKPRAGNPAAAVEAEAVARHRPPRQQGSNTAASADSTSAAVEDIDIDTGAPIDPAPDGVAAEPEPAFLHQHGQTRGRSLAYGIGALVLAVILTAQAALLMRTEILMRWPELRPQFVEACRHVGCEVTWPARADLLAVVGSELQQLPGTELFELSAVLRNRASFRIALPAVELTLTDPANRTLARKVFTAAEAVAAAGEPATRLDEGIDAGADHVVRITFEARGVSAASFVVYPFYP